MRRYLLILFFTFLSCNLSWSQDILGKWYSIDPNNEKETIIELYIKDDKLFGRIDSLLQKEDQIKVCKKCTGENKNKPLTNMVILKDFIKENEIWTKGKILIPKTGKKYDCNIYLENQNRLIIRGYIGFSIFGRSTNWFRVLN
jgi:hypothetical protein